MKEFGVMDAHGKPYTDETYTAAVDSGRIGLSEFQHPLINSAKADVKQKNISTATAWRSGRRKDGRRAFIIWPSPKENPSGISACRSSTF